MSCSAGTYPDGHLALATSLPPASERMPTKAAASASAAIRTRTTARGRRNAYESNSSYPLLCTKCPKEVNAGRRGILSLRPRHVPNVIETHVIGALAERRLGNQQREVQPERSDRPKTAADCR